MAAAPEAARKAQACLGGDGPLNSTRGSRDDGDPIGKPHTSLLLPGRIRKEAEILGAPAMLTLVSYAGPQGWATGFHALLFHWDRFEKGCRATASSVSFVLRMVQPFAISPGRRR
jgi:hypothetical protein